MKLKQQKTEVVKDIQLSNSTQEFHYISDNNKF